MKVSILDWKAIYWVDYTKQWAIVSDISDDDFAKIQAKTHELDIETMQVIEIIVPEPSEEEIAEKKAAEDEAKKQITVEQIKDMIAKKRAMEIVWENTDAIVDEIVQTATDYIDSTDISKSQKTALKSSILEKL